MPVVTDACYSCPISQQARVTQSWGYIASTTTVAAALTSSQPCGSARCPWRIEVESGQTIVLTLYDFAMEDRNALYTTGLAGGGEYSGSCYRYAIIKEETSPRDTPICGGRGRVKVVYTSVTSIIEIHVVSPEAFSKLGHFVIHYQGRLT